ncbi:hypothetical protein L21SP3_01671 [Sedimentisphaera cyanobacteriorum]|uniref:Uncharacterized protein n=1 Tax=Sedimentisphaera cyanobacteriorum TaxID=1940790 RepID=A0A1Q2HR09_9BACT|nr:hypothetical protein [Sedimentisphaera cyanobacteriorum]AQQ09852.1 hypothetical protein L21SP3_01671 [Sedimentisphaera cyanobacteriorum]
MRKYILILAIVVGSFSFLQGCEKAENKSTEINSLLGQIKPLQVQHDDNEVLSISVNQAMAFHENHEHSHSQAEDSHPSNDHHLCMGVLTGYQAIRYAVDELFGQSVPQASDFEISVTGPMDGVWDMMSLYTGKEMRFEGEPQPMDLKSFTFTARKISEDKSLVFGLRPGIIPEEFFELKNQGATCGNPELSKLKQQALLNILSVEPDKCFEVINNDSDAGQ